MRSHLFVCLLLLLSTYLVNVNARTQQVLVGGSSADNRWQFLEYYPNPVYIEEGDEVEWVLNSDEDHTVTFTDDPILKLGAFLPELFLQNITSSVIPALNATAISNSVDNLNTTVWVVNPLLVKMGATNITSENDTATSGLMSMKNESSTKYSLTFPVAGAFDYLCLFHAPGMTGTVVVLPKTNFTKLAEVSSEIDENNFNNDNTTLSKLNSIQELNDSISLVPDLDIVYGVFNKQPSSRKSGHGNSTIWTVLVINDFFTKGSLHRFVPSNFTVSVGDTVEFVNADIRWNVIVAFNSSGDFSDPIIGGCLGGCAGGENGTNATTPIVDPVYTARKGGDNYTGGFASSGWLFSRLNGPSILGLQLSSESNSTNTNTTSNNNISTNLLSLSMFNNMPTIVPHFNAWNITFKRAGTFMYESVFDVEEGMIGVVTVKDSNLLCA